MKRLALLSALFTTVLLASFVLTNEDDPVPIPPSKQREGGDPAKGYDYLINGDYVKGGMPESIFRLAMGKPPVYLQRDAVNEGIPHEYTAVKVSGEVLIAPNCFQCHSQVFEGQLYIGLGNTFADFSDRETLNEKNLEKAERFLKTFQPKKYRAAQSFFEIAKTVGNYLYTETPGVNPADRLAGVLAAHRDPVTFKWSEKPLREIPQQVVASDVPAWWLLKKKNGMFYNGFGRGDFGRFLMASNLLTVNDTSESAEVDGHMPDVLAYINSLEAPKYKGTIDADLVAKGKVLFTENCSACHGAYGENETYPNLLIPQSVIKTDSLLYSANYSNPQFIDWFNRSWFSTGDHPAKLEPFKGYIAPPLDGIWITAPYLHNGSVPTLDALLNSSSRPAFWSRNFESPKYDYDKIGWQVAVHEKAGDRFIYNTTLPGYGNYGHYFGDKLTTEERRAVIEYLKTL
jgi:hypothetical protein